MKNAILILVAAFSLSIISCGGGVKVSPEMEDFMSTLDGKATGVKAALDKHLKDKSVHDQGMSMYTLEKGKAVKAEGDCYTMECKAGITTRSYKLCWEEGKIASIEDLSGSK